MMGNREKIFFVIGVEKETKGRYLAKILRTQNGINNAVFDFNTRILNVDYNPNEITEEEIKKLTYFSECVFISDEAEIRRQIMLLKKEKKLNKTFSFGGILWAVVFLFVIGREFLANPDSTIAYIILLVLGIILGVIYYLRKKLEKEKEPLSEV